MIKSSWFYVKFKYNEKVSPHVGLFVLNFRIQTDIWAYQMHDYFYTTCFVFSQSCFKWIVELLSVGL